VIASERWKEIGSRTGDPWTLTAGPVRVGRPELEAAEAPLGLGVGVTVQSSESEEVRGGRQTEVGLRRCGDPAGVEQEPHQRHVRGVAGKQRSAVGVAGEHVADVVAVRDAEPPSHPAQRGDTSSWGKHGGDEARAQRVGGNERLAPDRRGDIVVSVGRGRPGRRGETVQRRGEVAPRDGEEVPAEVGVTIDRFCSQADGGVRRQIGHGYRAFWALAAKRERVEAATRIAHGSACTGELSRSDSVDCEQSGERVRSVQRFGPDPWAAGGSWIASTSRNAQTS